MTSTSPNEPQLPPEVLGTAREVGKNSVVVVMPKGVVPYLQGELNEQGIDLAVVDDGEDEGLMVLAMQPRPEAMEPVLHLRRGQRRWAAAAFFVFAASVVATIVLQLGDAAQTSQAMVMAYFGAHWYHLDRQLRELRRRQRDLQGDGL